MAAVTVGYVNRERRCFNATFRLDSALVDGHSAQQAGRMAVVLDAGEPLSPPAAAICGRGRGGARALLPVTCMSRIPAREAEDQVAGSASGQRRPGDWSVSFLVSFIYVRGRSAYNPWHRQPRPQTLLNYDGRIPTDLESVLEAVAAHDWHRRPRKRRACGPRGPTRHCAARMGSRRSRATDRTVLTDLLTTSLDHHGHGRTEEPGKQGRRDCLDSRGRL